MFQVGAFVWFFWIEIVVISRCLRCLYYKIQAREIDELEVFFWFDPRASGTKKPRPSGLGFSLPGKHTAAFRVCLVKASS